MSSILMRPELNKIFLIYGNLNDDFITADLQRMHFELFLNRYLKGLGYEQIVYYSGARNLGKYCLDDESAKLAIHLNGNVCDGNDVALCSDPTDRKSPRIQRPASRASAEQSPFQKRRPDSDSKQADTTEKPQSGDRTERKSGIVYNQPKMPPQVFLDEARKIMADGKRKSAIVFSNMEDFSTDHSSARQPYWELISHLWEEHDNDNIVIFLARETSCDLRKRFEGMENGSTFANKFFNRDKDGSVGTANERTTIEIGLPGRDELGFMLEYLRLVGEKGKRITYSQAHKEKIISSLMYLTRAADSENNGEGSLKSIYYKIAGHIGNENEVKITEESIQKIYGDVSCAFELDPLEKLKNTKGWESVAARIDAIIRDFRKKKESSASALAGTSSADGRLMACSNRRIDSCGDAPTANHAIENFVLLGNPGVGKTTVARLIGQIFYNEGILASGHTIEAKKADLVSKWKGDTPLKTMALVNKANEGVLLIDDAYSLYEEDSESGGANYSREAIDTLVPVMTNPKYRLCIIMAGYPKDMDNLLKKMNNGLKSRFLNDNILTIDDYKPDLLKHIFVSACEEDGYSFPGDWSGEATLDLDLFFNNLYNQRDRSDFGNARAVVNLATEVKRRCNLRDDADRRIRIEDFGNDMKYFIKRSTSSIDEVYARIDEYVGMGFIKDLFENVRFEIADKEDCKRRGVKPMSLPDHYIFVGNPGTGKTTVGEMIGELYHIMNVMGGDKTMVVDASSLIGETSGGSIRKTKEVLDKAIDCNQVLYIDEAYQISDSLFGKEIIGAMMTRMTENADDFKVVFGMYPEKVEKFLETNPGLSSRVRIVNFPDYTPEQLMEIFDRILKSQKYTITDEARGKVTLILKYKYDTRTKRFGNARDVERFVDEMSRLHRRRTEGISSSEPEKYEYVLSDIPSEYLKILDGQIDSKGRFGLLET